MVWKNLGMAYQFLSSSDSTYAPRFAVACAKFVATADANDPDLPAARQYLDQMRAAQRRENRGGH
jgi:hypothetical protein